MYSFIIIMLVILISYILLSFLLSVLSRSILNPFASIQKLTSNLKRKKLYSSLTVVVIISISTYLQDTYKLSDINYALLLGILFALTDVIFDKAMFNNR